eukprot:gene26035-8346_t
MGCSSSQIDALTNDNNSRSEVEGGGGDDATQFVAIERDGTSMSTFTRQVPGREISFMSPGDMQIVAATVNLTLEEAEVLYLRFKLLEPDRSSNMVFVSKFGEKIGTGFRHNTILYK